MKYVFKGFTEKANTAINLAITAAQEMGHTYIGTEHILLGLIHEGEGVAAKALESLSISLGAVREQVQEIIGQGQQAPSKFLCQGIKGRLCPLPQQGDNRFVIHAEHLLTHYLPIWNGNLT